MDREAAELFLKHARWRLNDDYWPRLKRCLDELSDEDIWRRPNDACNSVGNIMLHLCGNIRQWVVHGLGDAEDIRIRQAEFDERGPIPKDELIEKMQTTLNEVDAVLFRLDPETLTQPKRVQGYDETVLTVIFHIVEHFSYHLGQIVYNAKASKAVDFGFFQLNEDGYND